MSPAETSRKVDAELLEQVVEHVARSVAAPYAKTSLNAEVGGLDEYAREVTLHQLEEDAQRIRKLLQSPDGEVDARYGSPRAHAANLIARWNIDTNNSRDHGLVVKAVRQGMQDGYKAAFEFLANERMVAIEDLNSSGEGSIPPQTIQSPTISDIVCVHSDRIGPRSAQESRLALELFVEHCGELRMNEITPAKVRSFIKFIGQRIVGGQSPGSVKRPISIATVQKRVRLLSAAWSQAVDQGRFEGVNPFIGHKIDRILNRKDDRVTMPEKRPFLVAEMNAVFKHPWFTGCASTQRAHSPGTVRLNDERFWAPVVAALSGCRVAELGGLRIKEVRYGPDQDYPHLLIQPNVYRGIKYDKTRFVPIHPQLIELGFDGYLKKITAQGHDRVFPSWKPDGDDPKNPRWSHASFIRSFNRTVLNKTLGVESERRRPVSFHAFRGAFKTMLELDNNVSMNIIDEILGHAKIGMNPHYVGTVPLERTWPALSNARYSGLQLPTPPCRRSSGE